MNVILADDQAMIRESLKIVLECEPDIHVCATAQDGAQALSLIGQMPVDVAVLDIRMPRIVHPGNQKTLSSCEGDHSDHL